MNVTFDWPGRGPVTITRTERALIDRFAQWPSAVFDPNPTARFCGHCEAGRPHLVSACGKPGSAGRRDARCKLCSEGKPHTVDACEAEIADAKGERDEFQARQELAYMRLFPGSDGP